ESEDAGFAKKYIDTLAVRNRRARGEPVLGLVASVRLLGQVSGHVAGPEDFAGRPIHTDEVALEVVHVATVRIGHTVAAVAGDKDLLADDDRAGAPRSGQLPLPNHVLRIAPGCRQPFVWGDAKAAGATELKPISSIGGPDEHGEADNEQRQRFRFHDS